MQEENKEPTSKAKEVIQSDLLVGNTQPNSKQKVNTSA